MREEKQHILYLSFLLFFILILIFTIFSYYFVQNPQDAPIYLRFFVKYHTLFMLLLALSGVLFGSVTQYMTSRRIESNKEKLSLMKAFFLKSFQKDYGKIIDYLIKNNGVATQYELTKIEGLTKLKVSRILIDLEKKSFISKQKVGKINKVFLHKDINYIFSK